MKRLFGIGLVAMLVGCGGGSGTKAKHPDAAGAAGAGAAGMGAAGAGAAGTGAAGAGAAGTGTAGAGASGTGGAASGDADGAAGADASVGADAPGDVSDAASEEAAGPRLVTVAFTGQVVTVAPAAGGGMPLGFDSTVRLEPVSGSFTYDLRLLDDQPSDPLRGKYQRAGTTAFTFTIKGHTVKGSGKAIAVTENLSADTFRFLDGPQGDTVVRTMQFDGVDAPALKLLIAISDDTGTMLTSDALPDPFPTVDIAHKDGGVNVTHTFSLSDGGGTLLMQLETLVNQ